MAETTTVSAPTSRGVSVPAFEQSLKLNTLQAQKVMHRVFSRAAGSLYRIDVILRIIGSEENAEQVEDVISDMLKEVDQELSTADAETFALLEENGIDGQPVYNSPVEQTVRITSPQVARFVSLVRKLDKLIMNIDTLWLAGQMVNKEHNDSAYRWQQKVMGLGSRIIGLERRARLAAQRQGKGDQVEAEAPRDPEAEKEAEHEAQASSDSSATEDEAETQI